MDDMDFDMSYLRPSLEMRPDERAATCASLAWRAAEVLLPTDARLADSAAADLALAQLAHGL